MVLPDTIRLGGYTYAVKLKAALSRDEGALAHSCGNALEIEIDSTIPEQNQESALLHEIIEQINYRYELKLRHSQITTLETALYQVLRDHPDLFHT